MVPLSIQDMLADLTPEQRVYLDECLKETPKAQIGKLPPKTGRNAPCLCGSGLKYKRCCLAKDDEARRVREREVAEAFVCELIARVTREKPVQEVRFTGRTMKVAKDVESADAQPSVL